MSTTTVSNNQDIETQPASKPSGKKMSMAVLNFWLDFALFVTIIFIMWVTVMMRMIFPPPTHATGWSLWGLNFDQWHAVQFYALCICAALAVEHLVLHWNWICSIIATKILRAKARPDEGVQAVYGVGTLIGILLTILIGLFAALFSAKPPVP